jgi:hypothetical protein
VSPAAYLKAESVAPPNLCSKIPFPNRAMARKAMARMGKSSMANAKVTAVSTEVGPLHVYECSVCRCYHLAHRPKGKTR